MSEGTRLADQPVETPHPVVLPVNGAANIHGSLMSGIALFLNGHDIGLVLRGAFVDGIDDAPSLPRACQKGAGFPVDTDGFYGLFLVGSGLAMCRMFPVF
ncbi:hypothetical protein NQF87_03460 [Bombella sp. TMW 2.2559]|uniref:Uncharacterized protein n=1 Tax=Bombella dulcis TaxID=2967339 RepID=A0ABT3WEJ8_9PROT|nr:hypothetical protein [Bombella dulcis]MCX5616033.1 hypothetical protein [Bombella dulcis]